MSESEAIHRLDDIAAGDTERSHIKADEILLNFLRDNGFAKVADAYERVENREGGFWYA